MQKKTSANIMKLRLGRREKQVEMKSLAKTLGIILMKPREIEDQKLNVRLLMNSPCLPDYLICLSRIDQAVRFA